MRPRRSRCYASPYGFDSVPPVILSLSKARGKAEWDLGGTQNDTRECSHKPVEVGALDDPFILYYPIMNIKALTKMEFYAKITKVKKIFIKFIEITVNLFTFA